MDASAGVAVSLITIAAAVVAFNVDAAMAEMAVAADHLVAHAAVKGDLASLGARLRAMSSTWAAVSTEDQEKLKVEFELRYTKSYLAKHNAVVPRTTWNSAWKNVRVRFARSSLLLPLAQDQTVRPLIFR